MTELSRRRILRAGAGAAIAVPMTVLAARVAAADPTRAAAPVDAKVPAPVMVSTGTGTPNHHVMFCVHDASTGEVSVLHGTSELIVRYTAWLSIILPAAAAVPSSAVVAATTIGV